MKAKELGKIIESIEPESELMIKTPSGYQPILRIEPVKLRRSRIDYQNGLIDAAGKMKAPAYKVV